ncbi:hypothetical protein QMT40_003181 [Parvibaculaceae bacterium PLY_AMNH_Bact1]|nr:hypothetical protein QMT40_003181 [Parvibaculaceae bacterium PLY_AMNH_Bact1]
MRSIALLFFSLMVAGCSTFAPTPGQMDAATSAAAAEGTNSAPSIEFSAVLLERMSALPEPSAVDDAILEAAAEPYLNRPVSLDDLRALGTEMEGIFRDAGYPYVRVVLPPQEILNGRVRFQIIEGWVEGVSVLGPSAIAKAQTEARLAALDGKGPLALDDVERTVALLNDVPGLAARVSIARGKQGPGAMRLIADAERQDPRVLVNVQNFGSKNLGREGTTLFAHIPGWAPLGDELEVAAFNTWEPGEQVSGQIAYTRGLTVDGLTARVWSSYAEAEPSGAVATLGSTSESLTAGIELAHPIYLRREESLSGYLGFEAANLKGELFQGAVPLSKDETRTLYAGLEGEFEVDEWSFSGNVELRQGLRWFHASARGDSNLARSEADPFTRVVSGEFLTETPALWGMKAEIDLRGQWAHSPLMAIEEFSFGNYTVGRGYDPGAAAGDSAIAAAVTLSGFKQQFWNDRIGAELIAFYDVGRYWNEDTTGTPARTLASAGGGVRLLFNQQVRADITYAQPLDRPRGLGENRPGARVLFNITADAVQIWDDAAAFIGGLGEDPTL